MHLRSGPSDHPGMTNSFRRHRFSPSGDTVCVTLVGPVAAVYGMGGLKGKEGLVAAIGGAALLPK
jgi:hypothetical protein